jgi:hypothetical protein
MQDEIINYLINLTQLTPSGLSFKQVNIIVEQLMDYAAIISESEPELHKRIVEQLEIYTGEQEFLLAAMN